MKTKTKPVFIPGFRRLAENSPAQRYSKMSNGRLSGVFCWPHGRKTENTPAQQDSGMSKLPEDRRQKSE